MSEEMSGWKMYSGYWGIPGTPPPRDQLVQWQRGHDEASRFTARSADFDPLFNVWGLQWRSLEPLHIVE